MSCLLWDASTATVLRLKIATAHIVKGVLPEHQIRARAPPRVRHHFDTVFEIVIGYNTWRDAGQQEGSREFLCSSSRPPLYKSFAWRALSRIAGLTFL